MNLVPAFVRRRIGHRPSLVKIAQNIHWLFFEKILRMGLGLFVGVWIARYLGPEQFGLLSFAAALVALFASVATLGLQNIVVRDLVRDPARKQVTLGTAGVLLLLAGFMVYGFLLATISWLRPDDALARALVAILGSVILFQVSQVTVYWFESEVMSKYPAWVNSGVLVASATVKVGLILFNAPLIAFAWVMMAEGLLVAVLLLTLLELRGPRLRSLRAGFGRARALLADSWPLLLAAVAITIYMTIDQIMLGQMLGDEEVGIYSAAVRISTAWYFVPLVIASSVFPAILRARERSTHQYHRRLQSLYDLMVWLAVALALPMTVLATPAMTLLFGEAYADSGQVLRIHIWGAIFVFLGVASAKWIFAENRQILHLQRTLLGAVVNVVLNFFLIPKFGVIGAAWATLISHALASMLFDIVQSETRRMFVMKISAFNLVGVVRRLSALRAQPL